MKALLPLVNWGNVMIMIGVFAVVVIVLVVTLLGFLNSGKKLEFDIPFTNRYKK